MSSENLFAPCRACKRSISKAAKVCPHCGQPQRRIGLVGWLGIVCVVVLVIGLLNSREPSPAPAAATAPSAGAPRPVSAAILPNMAMPAEQARFIQSVTPYVARFKQVKNELQQTVLRDERRHTLSSALNTYEVNGWIGTVSGLSTNSEGKAVLSVRVAPSIRIKTWNNSISDISSETLIEKTSPLYAALLNMTPGQKIRFSGSFFPSSDDYITETSLTIDGSMKSPEFLFRFSSVTPLE